MAEPRVIPVEQFVMRGVGRTDVGVQRTQNEDAMYYDDFLGVYLVCDGMGGHASGQVASDPTADVKGQTEQILKQIDDLLEDGGATKKSILTATIYLADISTFAQMNEAWDAWVPEGMPPARATVEAKLAKPEYKVEIMVTACNGMSAHAPAPAAKAAEHDHGHDHGHDHDHGDHKH